MNNLEDRVNALSERLAKVHKKARNGAIINGVVYAVLVLFVLVYTTFIMAQLRANLTVDSVSAQIQSVVRDQLETLRGNAVVYAKGQIPVLTDAALQQAYSLLPTAESQAKRIIDNQIDYVLARFHRDLMPRLREMIDEQAEAINLTAETLKDEASRRELAQILMAEVDSQFEYVLNRNVQVEMNQFRRQLEDLAATPMNELSQAQAVQRKLIVNWMFLLEQEGSAQGVLVDLLNSIGSSCSNMIQSVRLPRLR